jgi:hypothetical protein
MEREWDNLKKKEGFADFHTSVFVARNYKSEFATWDDAKQKRVFRRICQITKKYATQVLSFAAKKDDYDTLVPDELRQYSGKYHYSWAMRHIASFAELWRRDRHIVEPYEWMFDWMEKNDPARKEIEAVMEQAEEQSRKLRGVEHDYEHFDFRPRASLAGLQCADLVAWTNYNLALDKFFNSPPNPFAKFAQSEFNSMPIGQSPSIHPKCVEWNFAVMLKPNHLADWATREMEDGRSIVKFRDWHERKNAKARGRRGV